MPNSALSITTATQPTYNSGPNNWTWSYRVNNLGPDAIPSGTIILAIIGPFTPEIAGTSLSQTSTGATIALENFSNNRYRITTNASIASGSFITVNVVFNNRPLMPPWTLTVSTLSYITAGFTPFTFLQHSFISANGLSYGEAVITEGLYAGSTSVRVLASAANGMALYVFQGATLIGQSTVDLATGFRDITLTTPIVAGLAYIAYVGQKGYGAYGPSIAVESNTGLTGWRIAETVNGTDISSWEGEEVASIYDPSETINVGYGLKDVASMFDMVPNFNIVISRSGNSITAEVTNISPWLGNARIQFDNGTINNTKTKTYTVTGSSTIQRVKVIHESNNFVYSEQVFTLSNTLVSSTTQIWGASYEPNKVNNQTVILLAYSKVPIEARIVQLTPSVGGGVGAWVSMTPSGGGAQKFTQPIYTNVPSGNYTAEYRVIGDTTVLTIPIFISWN
jgi:hypothetical protein